MLPLLYIISLVSSILFCGFPTIFCGIRWDGWCFLSETGVCRGHFIRDAGEAWAFLSGGQEREPHFSLHVLSSDRIGEWKNGDSRGFLIESRVAREVGCA